ncbi:CZB domain-containing protein [Massilia sp. TS11]|nr:CZB domain-containing protein [Massilia sp. TS11]
MKFRSAMAKHEQLDAISIGKDNCCELGKWLHGEGKVRCGSLPSFTTVVQKHAEFHREAGKVAQAINAKKYDEAERMLGVTTPYGAVSNDLGGAIMRLRKECPNN